MGKWLAALGAILLVVVLLLWRQVAAPKAKAAPPPAPAAAAGPSAAAPEATAVAAAAPTPEAAPAPAEPPAAPAEEKMDPQSDEFFRTHDEVVVPKMMREAVQCWENLPRAKRKEFHRNQSLTASFKQRIRDGVVTIEAVTIERSSISDAALEACFLEKLRGTTWSNKRLPDWDQDDQIKLGPRTLKKYMRANVEADETTLEVE